MLRLTRATIALTATAAALLAAGLAAGPALAVGTAYTGKGTAMLTDGSTSTLITCSSTVGGSLSSSNITTMTSASFTTCTGPAGLTFTLTGNPPWTVTTTTPAPPVQTGTIGGITLHAAGPSCSFEVNGPAATGHTGKVKFKYTPGTSKLKFLTTGGNLHIFDVSGCLGLVSSGDAATLGATYKVT